MFHENKKHSSPLLWNNPTRPPTTSDGRWPSRVSQPHHVTVENRRVHMVHISKRRCRLRRHSHRCTPQDFRRSSTRSRPQTWVQPSPQRCCRLCATARLSGAQCHWLLAWQCGKQALPRLHNTCSRDYFPSLQPQYACRLQ